MKMIFFKIRLGTLSAMRKNRLYEFNMHTINSDKNNQLQGKGNKTKSYKHVIYQLLNVFVLLTLICYSYITWGNTVVHDKWSLNLAIISLMLLVYQIIMFKPFGFKFIEFRTWFILLSYLFMFGRVYLHGFDMDENMYWDLSLYYPGSIMFKSGLIILCSLQSLFIGFSHPKRNSETKEERLLWLKGYKMEDVSKLVFRMGILLTCFTLPFRLFEDIRAVIVTQAAGSYSGLTNTTGFTDDIANLFVPGIIYIIVGLCGLKGNSKFGKIVLLIVIAYFIAHMVLTGDRRFQTTAIIAICLSYISVTGVKVNFFKMFILGAFGIFFLDILTTIGSIRLGNLSSMSDFFSYYLQNNKENSVIYSTLSGFGLTFFSVVGIVNTIPSILPYQWGLSFYGAIPSLLPIGWLFGDFFRQVSITNVVNKITGYPVGASLIGDSYANFGILSIFFLIIFGRVLTKIFQFKAGNSLLIAKYYSLFYILINLVRGSFFESFRSAFVVYFIPLIIIAFIKSGEKRKTEKRQF